MSVFFKFLLQIYQWKWFQFEVSPLPCFFINDAIIRNNPAIFNSILCCHSEVHPTTWHTSAGDCVTVDARHCHRNELPKEKINVLLVLPIHINVIKNNCKQLQQFIIIWIVILHFYLHKFTYTFLHWFHWCWLCVYFCLVRLDYDQPMANVLKCLNRISRSVETTIH